MVHRAFTRPQLRAMIVDGTIVDSTTVAAFGLLLLTKSFGLIARNLDVAWVSLPLSVALVYIPIPFAGAAVLLQSALAIFRATQGPVRPAGGPAL